ncbi:MAG: hypothetical protein ACE5R6_00555 [Candidatus Heimdallarchaeota archaeon]
MNEKEPELQPALKIKISSLPDLLRMIASTALPEQSPTLLSFQVGSNKWILASLILLPAWYQLRSLPILVYIEREEPPEGPFFRYRATEKEEEEIGFCHSTKDSSYGYIPIIHLAEVPEVFWIE